MAFEMFCVEIPGGRDELLQLNQFIASHRVVSKQQQMVERDGIPYMMCWLEYVPGLADSAQREEANNSRTIARKDVWDDLKSEDRERYERLRALRKTIAEAEHVKPFVIFTNEQLGEMITRHVDSLESLKKLNGVGDSRVEKYGRRFAELLRELWSGSDAAVEEVTETSLQL